MYTLAGAILENKSLSSLSAKLEGGVSPVLVSGLSAASRAQLCAALYADAERPVFVIAPDDTAAEALRRDIAALLDTEVTLLTGREMVFYSAESVSRQTEQGRIAALDALLTLPSGLA